MVPSIVRVPLDAVVLVVLLPLMVMAVVQDPLSGTVELLSIKSICIASSLNCSNTSSLRPGVALFTSVLLSESIKRSDFGRMLTPFASDFFGAVGLTGAVVRVVTLL